MAYSVRIDGRTSLAKRQEAVEKFQMDPECRVFIGSLKAAGEGITLTAADTVIFAELGWTDKEMCQAEDRLHRIGQKNAVQVIHIVLEGSLDERQVQLIVKKQEIADKTLNPQEAIL